MNTSPTVLAVILMVGLPGLAGCGRPEGHRLSDQTKAIVAGNNAFALDLYGQLKSTDGNLFFSPFSISGCLAMTYAGARGNTEKQMAEVLHFGTNQVQSAFGELEHQLNEAQNRKGIELNVASGLWSPKRYPLLPAFLDIARRQSDVRVQQFDFGTEAESARADINAWVKRRTRGEIEDVIPSGMLNRDSKLVLVNALYFKGAWKTKFDPKSTRDSDFHLDANQTVRCPTMYCSGKFPFYHHFGPPCSCEVLELPYRGKDYSLIAILPLEREGLADVESDLTGTNLAAMLAALQETDVRVSLPKFRLLTEFSLDKTLPAMGMSDAFDMDADFSGIDGTKMLFITTVRHRAFVEVSEEGTTAAAATASHHGTKGMSLSFRADHPFLFLIRDNRCGSILFLGRLVDPRK
jgi:serpin B